MNRILFLLFAIVLIAACKKAEEPTTVEDNIRGTWKRTSGKVWARNLITGAVDTTADYTTLLDTCVKDDALEFKDSYKGVLHLGAKQCNVGDPESVPFRWETTGNGTGLRIYEALEYFKNANGNVNASILTLTKTFMTLRYTQEFFIRQPHTPGGTDTVIMRDTATFTDIFRKQ